MGRHLGRLPKLSRTSKRKSETDRLSPCWQLAQRFHEVQRLREEVQVAECGRILKHASSRKQEPTDQ
jgi:hypothetical protein